MTEIYLAGGCLWGVQAFMKTLPGVLLTEAGRANGSSQELESPYDGYAECVKVYFDETVLTVEGLMGYLFEIIDPHSLNQQGEDVGEKYRTGVYSKNWCDLQAAKDFIARQVNSQQIVVEVLPLTNYLKSAPEHQDRLTRCPDDYCHLSPELLNKYK